MKFYTSKQLADFLEVTEATIHRWRNRGMPHKVGSHMRYYFDLHQVLNWVKGLSQRHADYVEWICEHKDIDLKPKRRRRKQSKK